MKLFFEDLVKSNKAEFIAKVKDIAAKLGTDPNFLMAVMWSESGLNHRAVNPTGGATGLIQFMPNTARALGTTTEALRNMTNVDQLDYVLKYYWGYRSKLKSFGDVYLVTFFPAAVGKPDSFVLETKSLSARLIAQQNPIFDLNKDGKVTVGEFKKKINDRLPDYMEEEFKKKAE